MDDHVIENFFGVYLLYCRNPKFKGRTYIGKTTDPNRRVKQHNNGIKAGGAFKTNNKGPWDMVLIVHGFPNDICALRFEWAWTYPQKSRRLKNLPKRRTREPRFDYCLRIVANMLNTKPWSRLPLTVRWLKQEYCQNFPLGLEPPLHMPTAYGPVTSTRLKSNEGDNDHSEIVFSCCLCSRNAVKKEVLRCLNRDCSMYCHISCLSKRFLKSEPEALLPISGDCPKCCQNLLWGDLIRQKLGCYQLL